ncbi:MAG TPA: hypothetical protein VOA41_07485 [Candidatus Dormibacteraeota bacterium]|nr:hypothetical protein [Candidatus Dormibacteraeota bacterium]
MPGQTRQNLRIVEKKEDLENDKRLFEIEVLQCSGYRFWVRTTATAPTSTGPIEEIQRWFKIHPLPAEGAVEDIPGEHFAKH